MIEAFHQIIVSFNWRIADEQTGDPSVKGLISAN
ncbi:Uncharacterised protein [Vibrio cholerae]|nr:Uncharacterised protein [Vibrio cholerae]